MSPCIHLVWSIKSNLGRSCLYCAVELQIFLVGATGKCLVVYLCVRRRAGNCPHHLRSFKKFAYYRVVMPSNSKSVAKDQEKEAMVHNTLRSLCLKQGNQDQLAWVTCDAVITPRLNSLLTLRKKNVCCNRSRNFLFQKGSCQKRSEHLLTSPSKTSRRKYTALDQKERNNAEDAAAVRTHLPRASIRPVVLRGCVT